MTPEGGQECSYTLLPHYYCTCPGSAMGSFEFGRIRRAMWCVVNANKQDAFDVQNVCVIMLQPEYVAPVALCSPLNDRLLAKYPVSVL